MLQAFVAVTKVDFSREGPWRILWPKALDLMSHLEQVTVQPQWTFGGGTVLMLRFDRGNRWLARSGKTLPDALPGCVRELAGAAYASGHHFRGN